MGVLTFFDFGPPHEYYSLYVVRPAENGTQVERIILTPEGNKCFAPAKVERAVATMWETVDELPGAKNPCEIPEKELRREPRRCKRCRTFSGANVTMQVDCGGETRLIRSAILHHDMFNSAVKTPENTGWTMRLLEELDKTAGPGVMDMPMFPVTEDPSALPLKAEGPG